MFKNNNFSKYYHGRGIKQNYFIGNFDAPWHIEKIQKWRVDSFEFEPSLLFRNNLYLK
jgi:hypothetical protein